MSQKLTEKFFNNQTTPAESQKVLEWFETSEGKQFLKAKIENDRDLMDRKDFQSAVTSLDSEKLFSSIQEEIKKKKKIYFLRKTDWVGYSIKAAAVVLVILTTALFTFTHERDTKGQIAEKEPVIFQTEEEQHREITLSDGSVVRLNKNSEIVISEDYMRDKREISLTGEAYFDVAHHSEKPFIIQTGNSSIEVLGTSFNVRSVSDRDNVQVAVMDGRVSFSAMEGEKTERASVVLSKGQYGYLDVKESSIAVDEIAIDNYLAWKSGRFIFDELTLNQVCTQLNRLYSLDCSFEDDELGNLHLTANFSNESLDKTLSVIALTLDIEYQMNEEKIIWTEQSISPDGKGNS